jgi:hypothetical protein
MKSSHSENVALVIMAHYVWSMGMGKNQWQ